MEPMDGAKADQPYSSSLDDDLSSHLCRQLFGPDTPIDSPLQPDTMPSLATANAALLAGLRRPVQLAVPSPFLQRAAVPVARRTAATAADNHRPPIELHGIDGTYANSLYIAASKSSTLNGASTTLAKLHQTFKKEPGLQGLIATPTLSSSDRSSIITELLKSAGVDAKSKDGATVKSFLDTLAEHNRLSLLDSVCAKFEQLMGARRGEIEMTITSAQPLDPSVVKRLETAAAKSELSKGKKLKVISKISPDIRGGIVVDLAGRTADRSLSSQLSKLQTAIRAPL